MSKRWNGLVIRALRGDIIARAAIDAIGDLQCMGCFRETELVCTTCLQALCLDCRAGHVCDPISSISVDEAVQRG